MSDAVDATMPSTKKQVRFETEKKRKRDDDKDDDESDDPFQQTDVLQAKRERQRRKKLGDDDDDDFDTTINHKTSLEAEGIPMEPFHMKHEENDGSGYFEGDTYVFRNNNDDGGEPDAWLDDMESIKPVAPTATQKSQKSTDSNLDEWSSNDIVTQKILPHMNSTATTTTILQAISRYHALLKTADTDKARQRAKTAFDDLTQAASALMLQGQTNIYQMTHATLLQKHTTPKSVATTATIAPPSISHNTQWEYKGQNDGQIHGPFTSQQMLNWTQSGYFVGDSAVPIRQRKQQQQTDSLLSDLLDDDDDDDATSWSMSDTIDFSKF